MPDLTTLLSKFLTSLYAGTIDVGGTGDALLVRDAPNTLAQRNGTNAQVFNLYNTYTSASIYERAQALWTANTFYFGTDQAGGGVVRPMSLMTGGQSRWVIETTGHITAAVDNTYDIGASGATRPRDLYLGRSAVFGGSLDVTGYVAINTTGFFNIGNLSKWRVPAAGQINFYNNADSAGVGLDFATDGTLKIRTRAQTGDALITSLGLTASGPTSGIGYATGAGGTVTQLTSKATGVTLNTVTGEITMNNAALAADTTVSFVLTNSAISNDMVIVQHVSGGTQGSYAVVAQGTAGGANIYVRNVTAGSLSEAIVLKFVVFKAVTS